MDGDGARIVVSGIVQGVAFRAYTREEANQLGLKGWVKNRRDGKVEILAEGPKDKIEALIRWSRRGPPSANVSGVTVEWIHATGEFPDFRITY